MLTFAGSPTKTFLGHTSPLEATPAGMVLRPNLFLLDPHLRLPFASVEHNGTKTNIIPSVSLLNDAWMCRSHQQGRLETLVTQCSRNVVAWIIFESNANRARTNECKSFSNKTPTSEREHIFHLVGGRKTVAEHTFFLHQHTATRRAM